MACFENYIFFLVWSYLVHRSVSKSLHKEWLFKDTAPTIFSIFVVAFCINQFISISAVESIYVQFSIFLIILVTIIFRAYSPLILPGRK